MKKSRWTALGVVLIAAALTSCTGSTSLSPSSSDAPTIQVSPSQSQTGAGEDLYTNLPTATWDSGAEQSVKAAAEAAAKAFVATAGSYDTWWAGYAPLLDTQYAAEAQYIDPARINVKDWSTVTVVNPSENPVTARVEFATNDGPWMMTLDRKSQSAPWLVMSFSRVGS